MTPFYCLRVTDKYRSGNGLEISYYTFKPLTPRRGQLLISPYNITPKSHIKVTRINEMIKTYKALDF